MIHVELILHLPENLRFKQSLAYPLYGMLCEKMPPALADAFHAQAITPLRQSVRLGPEKDQMTWILDLFGSAQELAALVQGLRSVSLEAVPFPLEVLHCIVSEPIAAAELLVQSAEIRDAQQVKMVFETPCSFKVAGQYALFPSAELIAQSLFTRWNALMPDCVMNDGEALGLLCNGLKLRDYRLSSRRYRLKGQYIPGFVGEVRLSARLAAPMMELWKLLLAFAPYSGVGIKTALGMGAVKIQCL